MSDLTNEETPIVRQMIPVWQRRLARRAWIAERRRWFARAFWAALATGLAAKILGLFDVMCAVH